MAAQSSKDLSSNGIYIVLKAVNNYMHKLLSPSMTLWNFPTHVADDLRLLSDEQKHLLHKSYKILKTKRGGDSNSMDIDTLAITTQSNRCTHNRNMELFMEYV